MQIYLFILLDLVMRNGFAIDALAAGPRVGIQGFI